MKGSFAKIEPNQIGASLQQAGSAVNLLAAQLHVDIHLGAHHA